LADSDFHGKMICMNKTQIEKQATAPVVPAPKPETKTDRDARDGRGQRSASANPDPAVKPEKK
jgi:hypothetical protein